MESIKLGYVHVPIHAYISRNETNTIQETRELTEEEKNFEQVFNSITFFIILAVTICLFISMFKMIKEG